MESGLEQVIDDLRNIIDLDYVNRHVLFSYGFEEKGKIMMKTYDDFEVGYIRQHGNRYRLLGIVRRMDFANRTRWKL